MPLTVQPFFKDFFVLTEILLLNYSFIKTVTIEELVNSFSYGVALPFSHKKEKP